MSTFASKPEPDMSENTGCSLACAFWCVEVLFERTYIRIY